MPTSPTTVLKHGGGVYTVTSSFAAPQALPAGVYTANFDPMSGYSISTLPDLESPTYRVYGRRDKTIEKVMRTYAHMDRSLGVLFEGDKGIGKSSTTVELARRMCSEVGLPVFIINHNYPGLSDFLGSLGECVIVLDEFEKTFPINDDDGRNQQNQFLTLFDGTDSVKRLYIVTVNDTRKLSPFLLNRPGRFHYLFSFDYPDIESITEYVINEAPGASEKQIEDAVSFAYRARLNYDHMRALVTELTIAGPSAPVSELVADLNIRDTEHRCYDITAVLADGTRVTTSSVNVEMFCAINDANDYDSAQFDISDAYGRVQRRIFVMFNGTDGDLDRRTGKVVITQESILSQTLYLSKEAVAALPDDFDKETAKEHHDGGVTIDMRSPNGYQFPKLIVESMELIPSADDRSRFF